MDNNQDKKNKNEERHATWLELFYDLVFVVTISQLSHYLLHDVSLSNFFGFLFLFIPVWWSWIGTTFFATIPANIISLIYSSSEILNDI